MRRTTRSLAIVFLTLWVAGWAWTEPSKGVAAIVSGLKGAPLIKTEGKDQPPSRQWTRLRLLQSIQEGSQLRVPEGGQLTLSFALGGRKVVLDGEVTVNVNADSVAVVNGSADRVKSTQARGREAVLAPRDRVDFSRMGGASARAAYVNVRTDKARPELSVSLIRKTDGSTFVVPQGVRLPAFYTRAGQRQWKETAVVGAAGDRIVADFDLEPGVAYDLQLLAIPQDSDRKLDYWVYRYTPEELKELENARQTQATPLEMVFLYRDFHLFDRAFAALAQAESAGESDREALKALEEELKADETVYQRGDGG